MAQSTPINQIRKEQNSQVEEIPSNDELVDDILKEMESDNNDINAESMNYAMDQSQIPPEKLDINFLENTENNNNNESNLNSENLNEISNSSQENETNNKKFLGITLPGNKVESMLTKCFNQVKYAFLVFIIVFLVSLPQLNRLIFTKIPGLLLESGEINIKGVLFKSVVATLIFLVISFFI